MIPKNMNTTTGFYVMEIVESDKAFTTLDIGC